MTSPEPPITIERPSDLPGSPMSAVIGWDQSCLTCGYNLRDLALRDACPECGTLVNIAIRRTRMVYQPVRWISRLRWGSLFGLIGVVLGSMLAAHVGLMIGMVFWGSSLWDLLWFWMPFVGSCGVASLALGLLLLSWGAPTGCRRNIIAERIVRVAAGLVLLAACTIAVASTVNWWYSLAPGTSSYGYVTMTSSFDAANGVAWFGLTLASPFLYFAGIAQLKAVARLIPSARCIRYLRWNFWLSIGFVVVFFLAYMSWVLIMMSSAMRASAAYQSNPNAPLPTDPWYDWIPAAIIMGYTAFWFIQSLVVFVTLHRALSRTLREAVRIQLTLAQR
ncbi:MAG: hypothetical protein H6813_00355 [Phycisphaeraceae bacterium]|nr:hypothetical protein [Phycisphaeraceae bacterium]MCB9847464.1 hypothetical protein [Phycisphaeraceae bacterium]